MTVAYHNTCKRYPFFFILSSILLKTPELCKRLRGFVFCLSKEAKKAVTSCKRTIHADQQPVITSITILTDQ